MAIVGILIIAFVFAYLIGSLRRLDPNEFGAVDFFGWEWYEAGPGGLIIVPLAMSSLTVFSTRGNQAEWPDEPENVQEENPDELEEGKTPPMRIVFAGFEDAKWYREDDQKMERPLTWEEYSQGMPDEQKEAIKQDPLQHTLVAKVKAVTQWRNTRGKLFQFMRAMGTPEDGDYVAEANRRINDTTHGTLQGMCGKITVRHALTHYSHLSALFKEAVEVLVGEHYGDTEPSVSLGEVTNTPHGAPWGIDLDTAYVKAIEPGKTVNDAISKASAAVKERQTTILNAQAEAEDIRLKGAAEGDAEASRGDGRARHIKAVRKELSEPNGKFAATLEVTATVAEKAKYIIAPEAGGLVATMAAIAKGTTEILEKQE